MATKLLSIEKAMKSDEVSLKNESIFDNENVASLKEMLYSIPNSINKNIYIHNLFMDEEFEDETDVKTERKTVNEKGARIRKLILTKQDKNKKISLNLPSDVLSTESDKASDSSSESGSSSSSESSIETDDNSVSNLKNDKTEKENNETIAKEESKKEKNASKPEETYPPMTQPVIIDFGDKSESEDSEPKIRNNENESESGSEFEDSEFEDSEFDDSESYDIEFSDSESEESELNSADASSLGWINSESSSSISSSIDFDNLTNDDDISSTTSAESYDEVEDDSSEESDINEYEISNDESENLSFTEDDYDYSDVSVDEENENNNLQNVSKEDKEGKKEKPDKNQKGEEPEFEWKDQSVINEDYADELREEARRIANLKGPYGMATEEGIDKLSNLLDDVLDYSSGISSKNNPIKDLVRNFNSIKTIQRGLVGNKKDLDVVATNIDEIKKNANEVSKARAAEISMQKTYLDKIIALNRFEYSEEIETMLRNALFDIHTNISQNKNSDKDANENSDKDTQETAKDEVFQNVGKILLPLLRTKNEPMNYNYDFQYDILKEIIRQEDFFSEIEGRSSYSDDDKSSLKVDPISSFILLRYLKTILYYSNDESIASSSPDLQSMPKGEYFKESLETTFRNIQDLKPNSSQDDVNVNDDSYKGYLQKFKGFVDSYESNNKKSYKENSKTIGEKRKDFKKLLDNVNKIIDKNYAIVKKQLSPMPSGGNIVQLNTIKNKLEELNDEIKKSKNGNVEGLKSILSNIIGNIGKPSNLVEVCGQKTAILENLKEMYKEARKHKATKPSTKPEEKKDATTTAAAPPNSATTAT